MTADGPQKKKSLSKFRKSLDVAQRDARACRMYYVDRMTYREVAEALGYANETGAKRSADRGLKAIQIKEPVGASRFSAVVADLPGALPDLMIQRKISGIGGRSAFPYRIDSGSPEFDRKFQVTTAKAAFAAKLIDASMIKWLLSADSGFIFKLYSSNLLLVWGGLLQGPYLGAIFDTAKGFTDHIPPQIWAEYGTR